MLQVRAAIFDDFGVLEDISRDMRTKAEVGALLGVNLAALVGAFAALMTGSRIVMTGRRIVPTGRGIVLTGRGVVLAGWGTVLVDRRIVLNNWRIVLPEGQIEGEERKRPKPERSGRPGPAGICQTV
ncbi:hypothetical protein B0T26DRAFT_364691 [Lasiosphaeria miniovina]|uniref:Uncharacterized protein n=1 Tax=Lasiosphaeria miniovina TaxID=1954250 RepID=A0AA40ACR7_9PEZI|nr:uncharacterized protein B0T26DRAFT_364691 [Lasiosphaeria miniovina]KAK0713441.1 hypothetical protein B0T26DRAFT_364691 [Lasiosphaeria miniovina]